MRTHCIKGIIKICKESICKTNELINHDVSKKIIRSKILGASTTVIVSKTAPINSKTVSGMPSFIIRLDSKS